MRKVEHVLYTLFTLFLVILALSRSQVSPANQLEKIRTYSRSVEFDYTSWTLDALFIKTSQWAMGANRYLSQDAARNIVLDYLKLVKITQRIEGEIERIYTNPEISDPVNEAAVLLADLRRLQEEQRNLGNLAESILQSQISETAARMGLSFLGQTIPPLMYHVTELPLALIVSPRDVIRQDANISLLPELNLDEISFLESNVAEGLNVSSMVTRIGGVGVYPTMVAQSTSLEWQVEAVAHEWIHNYLTWHPLGIRYDVSPELRTMNETTANIAGKEIGLAVLQRYYPEFVPEPPPPVSEVEEAHGVEPDLPAFDFNTEMRITRVEVDGLLAENKIEEAEAYMEQRRRVFWDNGYQIRVLNQAYFAFYGAYADVPGGAAGEDLVGPAVRALRANSASLGEFIKQIAGMRSFEELKDTLQ